jgi:HEAT repeat protein
LEQDKAGVRKGAVEALGKIGDKKAIKPLIHVLRDENRGTRREAAMSLDQLGWQPDKKDTGAAYWIIKGNWDKCVEIGMPAIDPLIVALKNMDEDMLQAATYALMQINGQQAVDRLLHMLRDESAKVRQTACAALDHIGWQADNSEAGAAYWIEKDQLDRCIEIGAPAIEPLIAVIKGKGSENVALRGKDSRMRQVAISTLAKIGGPRVIEALIDLLNSQDRQVGQRATTELGKLGNPAVEPLITALSDNDWRVREKIATALGALGDERAVEPLVSLLKVEPVFDKDVASRAKRQVIESLGKLGDAAVEPLISALEDDHWNEQYLAAHALKVVTGQDLGEDAAGWCQWWEERQ